MFKKSLILGVCLFAPVTQAHGFERDALLGAWKCGPYLMVGEGFEVATSAASNFSDDGSFTSISDVLVRLQNGKVVKTRNQAFGSWSFDGRIIGTRFDQVKFLWSDDPTYTVEMGQQDADAQLMKKSWSKATVLALDEKLITVPIESMYKGAEVAVTCVRP